MASDTHTVPDSAAVGLDLFAAAWLDQWTSAGGFVTIDGDGKGWFGHGVDAPDLFKPDPTLPEAIARDRHAWNDGHFHGRMRALEELMRHVPGGRDAVKAHVARFPSFGSANGAKGA